MAKVTVLIDKAGFQRLSAYCEERGFKKSTLMARLVREHLDREGFRVQSELPLETLLVDRRPTRLGQV